MCFISGFRSFLVLVLTRFHGITMVLQDKLFRFTCSLIQEQIPGLWFLFSDCFNCDNSP